MSYRPEKIFVIGSAKGMGNWLITKVFLPQGYKVIAYDIDITPFEEINAANLEVRLHNESDDMIEGVSEITSNDAVIIAVPMDKLKKTMDKIIPFLKPETLVFDTASIKEQPMKYMESIDKEKLLSLVGIHPLFGPKVHNPVGQSIIICKTSYTIEKHIKWMINCFSNIGLLTFMDKNSKGLESAQKHDSAMLYVQVLTHMTYLTFAKVISDSNISYEELVNYSTPPFNFLSAFAGRILEGNPRLYADIQLEHEELGKKIRNEFANAANHLKETFDNDTLEDCTVNIKKIYNSWRSRETKECCKRSKVSINSLISFEKRLYELYRDKKICIIKRKDNSKIHVGIIESMNSITHIKFKKIGFKISTGKNRGKYIIPFDEESKKTYEELGYNFNALDKSKKAKGHAFEINKRNFEIFDDEDCYKWIEANAPRRNFDLPIRTNMPFNSAFLSEWVPKIYKGINDVKYINTFHKGNGPFCIHIKINACEYISIHKAKSTIEKFLNDISENFRW